MPNAVVLEVGRSRPSDMTLPRAVIRGPRLPGLCLLPHGASNMTLDTSIPLTYQKRMRAVPGSFSTRPGSGVCRFPTHVPLAALSHTARPKCKGGWETSSPRVLGVSGAGTCHLAVLQPPPPKEMAPYTIPALGRSVLCSCPIHGVDAGRRATTANPIQQKEWGRAAIAKGLGSSSA